MTDTDTWQDLTAAQRAIWLDASLREGSGHYRVSSLFRVPSRLDPDLAREAGRAVMEAHEALRLIIDSELPRQRPGTHQAGFACTTVAADGLAALLADRAQTGFGLGEGNGLFRVELILTPEASYILLEAHHLVCDGFAIGIIRQDWVAAYEALAEGAKPALKPSPFLERIAADTAYLTSAEASAAREYWRTRLQDLPPGLFELVHPDDAPELIVPCSITLDAARYAALAEAARGLGATAHRALTVLAGLALARRHGREEVVLGMAQHGRSPDTLTHVGQFARLLPLRIVAPAQANLADAVRQAAAALDADFAHQRLPLDEIIRACDPGIDQRPHLVDAAISVMPFVPGSLPVLAGHAIELQRAPAREHSPLSFYARENADGSLRIDFGHDPRRVSAPEAMRMADRFEDVLARFIDRPRTKLGAMPRLGRDEAGRIMAFSDGPRIALRHALPLDGFAAQLAQSPDAPGLIDAGRRFSYAEIADHAARLAGALVENGVGKGDVVAVLLDRSAETVFSLLAILHLGAVYLPIDTSQPIDRAMTMLTRARVRLVIANPSWAEALTPRFVTLSADCRSDAARHTSVDPGDPAYIIFTSGSTGEPKGVIVPHRALANLDEARQIHDPIGAGSRILAAISVGFDVSMGQLLLPLLRGATIVIAPDLRTLTPAQFWDFLDNYGITHINSVPSFFAAMLDAAPGHMQLDRLMLGGEPLTPMLARQLRQRLNGTQVVNMYGPTEACVDASAYVVPADLPASLAALPIGRPLPNYSFHILDDHQMPVGIGHPGELCIAGPCLAIGYLDDPALTATRFVDSDYGRIYRTGDLASWREDGQVLFHGRDDGQVKIRGHRIELGEIQRALLDHADIAQAAVIARADRTGAKRLLAYAVAHEQSQASSAEIRRHLEQRLPHYMVPASVQLLPALPLTPNGKLDTRALPDPETASSRAPQGNEELAVAAHFAALLRCDRVGAFDNFFDLGGHSLLATQLSARISTERGINLPVRAIYQAPTVAALARLVSETPMQSWRAIAPRDSDGPPPPLAFGQEQLWIIDQLEPASAAYSIMQVFLVSGPLDLGRLKAALAALIARHEALRTGFVDQGEGPVQIIVPSVATPWRLHDVRGADEATVRRAVIAALGVPFDLAEPPLVRLDLFELSAEQHVLAFCAHHIIADGLSMATMMEDLSQLYAGTPCPSLELASADHAVWQRTMFSGSALEATLDWWRDLLAGASDWLDLPTDADAAHDDGVVRVSLDSAPIAALVAATATSPFAVLMAAWGLVLGSWAGQSDIILGTVLAGRRDPRLDRVVGLFANTLPLRVTIDGTVADLISGVHATILDVHDHQDLPLGRLVERLRPRRVAGRHPLFQALMVVQPGAIPQPRLGPVTLSPLVLDQMPARFDLALSVEPAASGHIGEISFSGRLFRPDTISELGRRLRDVLFAMAADPIAACRTLPALDGWARPFRTLVPTVAPVRRSVSGSPAAIRMAALWADILGTGPLDVDANFFEIGGHSLAAMQVIARLEQQTGQSLPASLLFDHQTPAQLAAALDRHDGGISTGGLTTLRAGDGATVLCLPGVGGSVMAFAGLAALLPPGITVLGAQPQAQDLARMSCLDHYAAQVLASLRAMPARGPYILIGHSLGGFVAHALARQMESNGQTVAAVILLDSDVPGAVQALPDTFLAKLPASSQATAREQVRLAQDWRPAGPIARLKYLRADGDGRDDERERAWLALADCAQALEPMPCGHFALLDHPGALVRRLGPAFAVNQNLEPRS